MSVRETRIQNKGGEELRITRETNQPVSGNISRILKERGLKQGHLANRAGIPEKTLSDMLNSRKIIRPCEAVRIADALEVDVMELFRREKKDGREKGTRLDAV